MDLSPRGGGAGLPASELVILCLLTGEDRRQRAPALATLLKHDPHEIAPNAPARGQDDHPIRDVRDAVGMESFQPPGMSDRRRKVERVQVMLAEPAELRPQELGDAAAAPEGDLHLDL